MIAQRNTSYNPMEMSEKGAIQAVLALLSQRHPVRLPRWDCEVCGMIHLGQMPPACESCGHMVLVPQVDIHHEINSHW
ncbi:MAG TPA: hypothetical protein VKV19_06895 [Ktedonobacteraceae bacterium]|nr:hypothetical protein [Ktedonobacteraceae bacterium]